MGAKTKQGLVVLVDDDPEILHSLGRLLRRERFELLTTGSPAQALEWARQRPVDLVITDQRMPEMSGTELLGRLRESSPGTKGVILSGFPDTALIVEQSGLRIEMLIAKPWENDSLKSTVRDLLGHDPGAAAGRPVEIPVDCTDLNSGLVLAEIIPACRRAPAGTTRAIIILKNLLLLRDSLSRVLKDLARAVVWLKLPIEIRDDSGCVNAFLEALDERPVTRPREP